MDASVRHPDLSGAPLKLLSLEWGSSSRQAKAPLNEKSVEWGTRIQEAK